MEDTLVSNVKLVCGTLAVIAAVYSHFGVGDFPASRNMVLLCVSIYLSCSALINILSMTMEASAMFVGRLSPRVLQLREKEKDKGKSSATSSTSVPPARVWVHTAIGGKGSSAFRVQVRSSVYGKADAVEGAHGYERYFTAEGAFLKDVFYADMAETLGRASDGGKKTQ